MTRISILPAALAAILTSAALAAWGTFGEETHSTREYLVVLAIIGVAALVVFGWAVPRALRSPVVGWTAVVLGVLGLVTVVAFWSGLPPVFAAGAALLGWTQRESGRGKVAIALGVLALLADIAVYVGDRL
jgi:membrane associated rhomboid family serine protease